VTLAAKRQARTGWQKAVGKVWLATCSWKVYLRQGTVSTVPQETEIQGGFRR
jgi:hypothetical protein